MILTEEYGQDTFGDEWRIKVHDSGIVTLVVNDSVSGESTAEHDYTPPQAKKLAKRLKKAAKLAQQSRGL